MVKLLCQDCGKVIEGKRADVDESECDCGGSYAVVGSDDDTYEANECDKCKKDVSNDETFSCDECGDDNICKDCICSKFENVNICRKCLEKESPSKTEVKVEYKDKIVERIVYVDKEGVPIDAKFNPINKSRFD